MARDLFAAAMLVAFVGCASAPGATRAQLDRRAALDLGCDGSYLQHSRLDSRTVLVQGCQRRVVYVESCQHIRGAYRCTWTADSPWLYAPTIHVVQAAPTPPPAAPPPPAIRVGEGQLDVVAVNGTCNVSIDGRALGSTPLTAAAVAAGFATVTCVDGDRNLSREVQIETGETTRVRFDLSAPRTRPPRDYGF